MKIKNGDTVIVISGKDKGKTGNVIEVLAKDNKVIVEGVNIVTKHQKANGRGVESGLIKKEAPIDVSNVMYYDAKNKKGTRLGYKFEDGKKVRFMKSNNETIK
ncbi:MAG: 50S ribosomal protein L24 [Finegoldia magna]|uniref:50S ribosomal protein L24 n=1 Tax=Finegoldia magna TaxID=1260 RepID=UPI00290285EF|nr:50S ribosomal protein L24 [Finegoldia magna]MDU2383897.1 50S ribosomal protein L24 [Finegoldia magna]MDU5960416.1 50S ribosomal protein L24 [Finegoldia magna]